jgi:hypothetical protein
MSSKRNKLSFKIFSGFTPYIDEDGAKNLKEYKYSGGDNGILYTYFYNPCALKMVSYLPETIA